MTKTTAADLDTMPEGASIKHLRYDGVIMFYRKAFDGQWTLTGPYSLHTSDSIATGDGTIIRLS